MAQAPTPEAVPRLSPQDVRGRMQASPGKVHLICAYDDVSKCRQFALDGAKPLKEFEARVEEVGPDDDLVFYCA